MRVSGEEPEYEEVGAGSSKDASSYKELDVAVVAGAGEECEGVFIVPVLAARAVGEMDRI